MFRIDNDTASTTLPTPKPVGQPGFFTAGTIGGEAATIVEADWLNLVQEELLNVLAAAGIAPSKLTNSQVIQAILYLIANNTRQRLTGPLDLYCDIGAGSDTNNGLTPTTAFATPQAAWNYIMTRLDVGYQTVTVNMAPGTYPPFSCDGVPVGAESQNVIFQGVLANPGEVTINNSGSGGSAISVSGGARVLLQGFSIQSNAYGLYAWLNGCIYFKNLQFLACGAAQVQCDQHGLIEIVGAYTIAGGAPYHLANVKGGHMGSGLVGAFVVTLLGTPTFSQCYCYTGLTATSDHNYSMTFNGGAHGSKFAVNTGGSTIVPGANVNYFPGDVAGTIDSSTFGLYT